MPAIASIEDLKAAQREGVSIYAMPYALCSMLYGNGAALGARISVSCGLKNGFQKNCTTSPTTLLGSGGAMRLHLNQDLHGSCYKKYAVKFTTNDVIFTTKGQGLCRCYLTPN
jgi:hypothetical protein